MKTPRGQLAYFRVFPERTRSRLHFRVRVFESAMALRRYLNTKTLPWKRTLGRHGKAMCSSWTRLRGKKATPDCGEILLMKGWLGTEVIAHECTHAALGWAERIGLKVGADAVVRRGERVASDYEERFCYALGQMARQIVAKLYQKRLLLESVAEAS